MLDGNPGGVVSEQDLVQSFLNFSLEESDPLSDGRYNEWRDVGSIPGVGFRKLTAKAMNGEDWA